jgi:hypothetical protein
MTNLADAPTTFGGALLVFSLALFLLFCVGAILVAIIRSGFSSWDRISASREVAVRRREIAAQEAHAFRQASAELSRMYDWAEEEVRRRT